MRQLTLAMVNFDKHHKVARRAAFLAELDQVVPRRDLCAMIEPIYPKPSNGRLPIGLERQQFSIWQRREFSYDLSKAARCGVVGPGRVRRRLSEGQRAHQIVPTREDRARSGGNGR
jgi:hypothetical protein